MDKNNGIFKGVVVCTLVLAVLGVGAGVGYKYRHEIKNGINKIFTGESSTVSPGEVIKPDAPLTSTVKLNIDGNITTLSVVTGETLDKIQNPTKEGYEFRGWYIEGKDEYVDLSKYRITEDTIFIAAFAKIKYLVTFIVDDERTSVEFEHGDLIKFSTPVKEGYTFYRWVDRTIPIDLSTYRVTGDVTLQAEFLKNVLTVKFEILGEIVAIQEVPRNGFATVPNISVEREGYIFKGWSVDIENYPITRDYTIVARYEGINRTVRFIVDNEVLGESITVKNGESLLSAPIPEKEGFKFIGWQFGDEIIENVPLFKITQDTDFIAVFEEKAEEVLLPFDFEGSTITKYTGTETNVVFPTSYSLGEKRELEYSGLKGAFDLSNFFERGREVTFPITIINSLGDENTFDNQNALNQFIEVVRRDDKLMNLDFNVKMQGRPFIVGNDIAVTTIGNIFRDNNTIESVIIPEGITTLNEAVFNYCQNLKEITISNTVVNVGDMLFSYCNALKSITLPDSITYLSENMFMWCEGLEEVNLPETLTRIDRTAFYGCTNLKSVKLPASLQEVGEYIFGQCTGMEEIVCYSGNITFGDFETISEIEGMKLYLPDDYCETFVNAHREILGKIEVLPLSSYNTMKENILSYLFNDNTIMGYKGEERDVTLPSSYSIGSIKEKVFTTENMEEFLNLLQQQMTFPTTINDSSDVEIVWNSYEEFLEFCGIEENGEILNNLAYPVSVTMLEKQYVKGEDIQITRLDGFFNQENNTTEIIRVPAGIETIGESAFLGYSNLRKFICYSTPTFENLNNCPQGLLIYIPDEDVDSFKANNTVPEKVIILPLSESENALIHTLTFIVGENTYTEEVEHGNNVVSPTNISIPNGYYFDYWLVDGKRIARSNVGNTQVFSDMTLTADLYEVFYSVQFMVDGQKIYQKDVKENDYLLRADFPDAPAKEGYRFVDWYRNGREPVGDAGAIVINQYTNFVAVYEKIVTEEKVVYPFEVVNGVLVRYFTENTTEVVTVPEITLPNTYSLGNKISRKTKRFNNYRLAYETMRDMYSDIQYPITAYCDETGQTYTINSVDEIDTLGDSLSQDGIDFREFYFIYETYEIIQGNDYQITEIGENISYNYEFLTVEKFIISEGIQKIGNNAFYYTEIQEIVIPRSVTSIGKEALAGIKNISYAGTEEEWNAITFGENAIDEDVTINFNYVG